MADVNGDRKMSMKEFLDGLQKTASRGDSMQGMLVASSAKLVRAVLP